MLKYPWTNAASKECILSIPTYGLKPMICNLGRASNFDTDPTVVNGPYFMIGGVGVALFFDEIVVVAMDVINRMGLHLCRSRIDIEFSRDFYYKHFTLLPRQHFIITIFAHSSS